MECPSKKIGQTKCPQKLKDTHFNDMSKIHVQLGGRWTLTKACPSGQSLLFSEDALA